VQDGRVLTTHDLYELVCKHAIVSLFSSAQDPFSVFLGIRVQIFVIDVAQLSGPLSSQNDKFPC
jgi:hypothetical protein